MSFFPIKGLKWGGQAKQTFIITMRQIITLSYSNKAITFQRQEDGYINATALCQNAGKQIGGYLRNSTTNEFLQELSIDMQINISEIVQIQKGGEPHLQGTWVHPQVAINLAQWLSPKFAVQVSKWVENWITNQQTPKIQTQELSRLEILQLAIESEQKAIALENKVKEKETQIEILQLENLEKDNENKQLKENIKDFFKGAELFTRRQVCHFLARQGLQIKEQDLTDFLNKKKWLCTGEYNKNKATAESCRVGWFVNDISAFERDGRKKTNEYGKFTVDGMVGMYNYFKISKNKTSRT